MTCHGELCTGCWFTCSLASKAQQDGRAYVYLAALASNCVGPRSKDTCSESLVAFRMDVLRGSSNVHMPV